MLESLMTLEPRVLRGRDEARKVVQGQTLT